MLKLLTCTQGHYWEKHVENGADGQHDVCPVCGHAAESMPLLDLAASEVRTATPVAPPPPPPLRDKDGRPVVAGYEVLEDLGKSPTGVYLYRARQLLVNRTVLLKVVFAKDDPGQLAWGSLRGEAGALGKLAHPNIVQVLDAGERDRQLFYNAIEHIEGPTLAEALEGKPLPFRQALALIETLARAMHHAHEKGVLHRALKPASILLLPVPKSEVRMQNGKQASSVFCILHSDFCIPKITDFGMARRLADGDAADVELQGELPCYLSPEQAWGRTKEIGPATDVYALGAILYELLTGQPPFRADTVTQTLDAIQCKEVVPPSRRRGRVPRDLDAICRKCLAKQPRRRYPSALELADDLRRCAGGYPIKARAAGSAERFGKWLRRNARTVALVLLSLATCVSLLALFASGDGDSSSSSNPREQNHRQTVSRLENELAQARQREAAASYLRNVLLAERELRNGDRARGQELLNQCRPEERQWEWYYLRSRLRDLKGDTVFSSTMPITSVDLSADGKYLAIGAGNDPPNQPLGGKGEVSVWSLTTGARLWQSPVNAPVRGVAFGWDSARVALVSSSEKREQDSEVQLRYVLTGQVVFPPRSYRGQLTGLAFSSDQMNLIAVGGNGLVRTLQAHDGRELQAPPFVFQQGWQPDSGKYARVVPLSSDGGRLALISPKGDRILIHSGMQRGNPTELRGHNGAISALAYDEHSETLATASSDQTVRLWNLGFPYQNPLILRGHKGAVTGVTFSGDGKRLATCSADGTVKIWDPELGVEVLTLKDYSGVTNVLFSRNRNQMAFGRMDMDPVMDRLAIVQGAKVTVLGSAPNGWR